MITNPLKRAFSEGRPQIGLWSAMSSHMRRSRGRRRLRLAAARHRARAERTDDGARSIAGDAGQCHRGRRASSWNDPVQFKRLLDIGVQSLLVPFVQTPEEARTRGRGHAISSRGYARRGDDHARQPSTGASRTTSRRQQRNLRHRANRNPRRACGIWRAIAAVDGVDGLFIGPNDLAADMGHLGDSAHPGRARRHRRCDWPDSQGTGKIAGILAPVEADARHWLELGCGCVAVGSDVGLLARQSEALAAKFKPHASALSVARSGPQGSNVNATTSTKHDDQISAVVSLFRRASRSCSALRVSPRRETEANQPGDRAAGAGPADLLHRLARRDRRELRTGRQRRADLRRLHQLRHGACAVRRQGTRRIHAGAGQGRADEERASHAGR